MEAVDDASVGACPWLPGAMNLRLGQVSGVRYQVSAGERSRWYLGGVQNDADGGRRIAGFVAG